MFVMGRPGAGKDTQADLLCKKFNLIRISTSDLLKKKLYNSDDSQDNELIKKEREIFESGVLNTPSWVLDVVKEYIKQLEKNDFDGRGGIIFSGSPRTLFEAKGLIPFIENIFGKENMFVIYLDIPSDVGIKRIVLRNETNPRALDENEQKLKIRMEEFEKRTRPVLEYLKNFGILITVDGTLSINKILKNIEKKIDLVN